MLNILDQFSPSSIKMKMCFILSVVILNTIYAKPFGHSAIGASGYKRVNMNDFLKKKEQSFAENSSRLGFSPRRILVPTFSSLLPPDYHSIFEFKEKLARKVGIFSQDCISRTWMIQ